MGQKINPIGFRVGISKDWTSRWFAGRDRYADLVLEDVKLRKFLEERLSQAGLKAIEIERTQKEVSITLKVSKPGMVIGKGGTGVEELEKSLRKLTKSKVKVTAEEVRNPEIEAQLVAGYLCRQLKRRVPYRRSCNFAIRTALEKGVKGIKIKVSGVLSGSNTISRTETFKSGSIPLQTLRADIDYAQVNCNLIFGTIGVKVWIYKGELDF